MKQQIRFDKTTKILSIVVLLIPVALFILPAVIIKDGNIIPILTSLFLVIAFVVAWMLHPTSYEITDQQLLVHRPLGPIRINLSDIIKMEKTEPGFSVRLFGSGGLFGYYGIFSSGKLGRHLRYTGNNENLLFVNAGKKKYLLSIHDELFYNELIKRTK
jgi:hypothetical protein